MENKLIWIIIFKSDNNFVDIELCVGRNKYTKAGLFSGPLRRKGIEDYIDENYKYLLSLNNYTQIGKNKYKLHISSAFELLKYFEQKKVQELYCFLDDKKYHHVKEICYMDINNKGDITYNAQTGTLFISATCKGISSKKQPIESIKYKPIAKLFLYSDTKEIYGLLMFQYENVEVPANETQEVIQDGENFIYRNLQSELSVQEKLIQLGARKSYRNEIVFHKKVFYENIEKLILMDIALFWGEERKQISKASFSCNISYGVDWFTVEGEVKGENQTYTLSELLSKSRGKQFVEIDDGLLYLPEELRKISGEKSLDGGLIIPKTRLMDIVAVAEKMKIDSSKYLDKMMSFSPCSYSISNGISSILKEYQKEGVQWVVTLYKNGFGCCLADDMGLGKTLQAISFICCNERDISHPVLIIAPKIVLYNWKNEFAKFAPEYDVRIAYGMFDYSRMVDGNIVYLTTYDTVINHQKEFESLQFDSVIIDESQYIKNFRTKRYKAIYDIKKTFVLTLTGTPIENSVEELWALFNMINPGMIGTHAQFMKRFGNLHNDTTELMTLKRIVAPFILRRTKEQVLKDLPMKEEQYIYCKMENNQRKLYDTILLSAREEMQRKPSRFKIKDNSVILQALLYLREVCSDPLLLPPALRSGIVADSCKIELFKEYAQRVLEKSEKLIVYGMFPKVLRKMENWCIKQGWDTYYIDGSINNRQEIVDKFETSNSGIFFISMKAGGVGLNLVSCQYVFIYDPWWNTAAEQQASNRVYRIGQDKPVFIYHFLVADSIEEKIYELQRKKEFISNNILDNLDSASKISITDFYELLF